MKKHKLLVTVFIGMFLLFLLFGLFVPIGSYKSKGSCVSDTSNTVVILHLISGETLQEQRDIDARPEPVGAGCSISTHYKQYLL